MCLFDTICRISQGVRTFYLCNVLSRYSCRPFVYRFFCFDSYISLKFCLWISLSSTVSTLFSSTISIFTPSFFDDSLGLLCHFFCRFFTTLRNDGFPFTGRPLDSFFQPVRSILFRRLFGRKMGTVMRR